jgi:hypothetical protein
MSSPAPLYLGYAMSLAIAALGGALLLRNGVVLLREPEESRRRRHAATLVRACGIIASVMALFATGWLSLTATLV